MAKGSYEALDLKAVRCFFAMANHGSLTKAGIELGISEAAVSQRVKGLERALGVKLYEARGGRVRLTPAGERALSFSISVFDQIEEFRRDLTQSAEIGEVVLSTHDSVLGYLLPDAVQAFSRAHPLARLKLLARPIEETLRLLKANEADVGVIPNRELPRDLAFQPIATFPAYLLAPKGHAIARRARVNFRDVLNIETIRRYPLIAGEVQLEGGMLAETIAQLGLPLNVGMTVGTVETVKRYAERGLGIALVSGLCVTGEDKQRLDVVEVPKEFRAETTYGVVLRRGKHKSALLRDLLRLITRTGGG